MSSPFVVSRRGRPRTAVERRRRSAPISSQTSRPPVSPRQRVRIEPDERVAVVDRHEPVPARAARAVDEQRLHVGLERAEHRVRLAPARSTPRGRAATPSPPSGPGSTPARGRPRSCRRRTPSRPAGAARPRRRRRARSRRSAGGGRGRAGSGGRPRRPPSGRTAASTGGTRTSARACSTSSRWRWSGAIGALHRSQCSSASSRSRARAPRHALQRRRARRGHAVAPSATRATPSAPTSSGTGSRWCSDASRPRPAWRTS